MKRLLREPLLHFLLFGAVIFVAYSLLAGRVAQEPGQIVVTQGQLASMMEGFTRTWQRPPTNDELEGLIRERVREEVYYREALALGLDKDDLIIRRRLRQKMEFIANDVAAPAEPSEAELADYLAKHSDRFRVEPRFTFRQVYLNAERRGDALKKDAERLLAELNQTNANADFKKLGDATLLSPELAEVRATEVVNQFGEEFTRQLTQLPKGRWDGPVTSGYGVHLVFVEERQESRMPELAEVREQVVREWADARRREDNEQFFQNLLKRYTVTIEGQESSAEQKKVVEVRR
jgi:hypothetical protein